MKLVFDSAHVQVYDDVLSKDEFSSVFDWFNFIPLAFKSAQGEWNRLWSFDSQVLSGVPIVFPSGRVPPFQGDDKVLIPLVEKINSTLMDGRVTMTPYCYPPGSGLTWHNDSNYKGAFTFYCHNYWSPEWGGEFQSIEVNGDVTWKIFDNQELYDLIMSEGIGNFVHPKPNRLIINSGILHKVNKTTTNSRARLTLQGFVN